MKIFLYVTNRFVRSILSGISLHCTTATWLHQNRRAKANATLIFEKIGKFIFLISKRNITFSQLLCNIRADMQAEFNVWQRHGREIIEEVERWSKLHDEPNAWVLRRLKFFQVSSRAFVTPFRRTARQCRHWIQLSRKHHPSLSRNLDRQLRNTWFPKKGLIDFLYLRECSLT